MLSEEERVRNVRSAEQRTTPRLSVNSKADRAWEMPPDQFAKSNVEKHNVCRIRESGEPVQLCPETEQLTTINESARNQFQNPVAIARESAKQESAKHTRGF